MTERSCGLYKDIDTGESGKQQEMKTSGDTQREADAERQTDTETDTEGTDSGGAGHTPAGATV